MRPYTALVRDIIVNGTLSENRTGIPAYSIPGAIFQHNMSDGFPLLTTKSVPLRLVASELEFFIKGSTDKKWYKIEIIISGIRGVGERRFLMVMILRLRN